MLILSPTPMDLPRRLGRRAALGCLLVSCLMAGGCQQRMAGKLEGEWIGRPDTAAARAKRENSKYEALGLSSTVDVSPTNRGGRTDWENYDVTVELDFVSRKRLNLSLLGGDQPHVASWKIIETSPTGCRIEVVIDATIAETAVEKAVEKESIQPRRFSIELDERDGRCVGFLLSEVGADRRLGALYFQRPNNSRSK